MKFAFLPLHCLLFGLLLSFSLASAAIAANGQTRTLTFPKEYSMGRLSLFDPTGAHVRPYKSVAATGVVTLNVPPLTHIGIEINPRCIEHPERLANLPTVGLDQINMTYMSMEDGKSACDKALVAMPLFKHPLRLVCIRTDVSDDGLLAFKSLSVVNHLDCSTSGLDGHFLKDTKRLQNLTILDLSSNGLKAEYVKYLAQLPKLESLDLTLTDLTNDGMQAIGQLKHLKGLHIASAPKVTDAGLQFIQNCTTLELLDLSYDKNISDKSVSIIHKLSRLTFLKLEATKITAPALMQLKDLKLSTLILPQSYWKVDVDNLRKAFKPGVVRANSREFNTDIEAEFGPLK